MKKDTYVNSLIYHYKIASKPLKRHLHGYDTRMTMFLKHSGIIATNEKYSVNITIRYPTG